MPAVYASGGPKCHHIMVPSSLHSRSREKERPGGYLALHDRHSAFVPGGCGWPIRSIPSHGSYHMRERNSAPSYGMNLSGGVAVFDRSPDWSMCARFNYTAWFCNGRCDWPYDCSMRNPFSLVSPFEPTDDNRSNGNEEEGHYDWTASQVRLERARMGATKVQQLI